MNIIIKPYNKADIKAATAIWNEVVEDGIAFPQTDCLTEQSGDEFFISQSFTGIAYDTDSGKAAGLYILHPNNIGRCGHICNASFAVSSSFRGNGVGEILVKHCLQKGKELGFKILQFNAVVATNTAALSLYKKLGFTALGTIPNGFMLKNGSYEDIVVHYKTL